VILLLLWLLGWLHLGRSYGDGGAAVQLDAAGLFNPAIEPQRRFNYRGTTCSSSYAFRDLQTAFASHSAEWSRMGREAVWWSVLTGHAYGADISPNALAAYYAEGVEHVSNMYRYISYVGNLPLPPARPLPLGVPSDVLGAHVSAASAHDSETGVAVADLVVAPVARDETGDMPTATALDFGCGTGRLSHALLLSGRFRRVVCVDQSVPHLQTAFSEAQRRLGPLASRFVPLLSGPQLLARLGGERFDAVFSLITLQHMVPPLQVAYIQ
jgi:hypothetical protein